MIETVKECTLCGDTGSRALAEHADMTWVRCRCGLVYKRRYAATTEPAERFDESYFRSSDRIAYASRTRHRTAKARRQILDLLNHAEPGPLLDIGCSMGYALAAAQGLGLEPTGVDISTYAVEQCRKNGFRAECAGLDSLPFEPDSFQLILMKHVLEHTPTPAVALSEVHRVLRQSGALFIAVPNAGYLKARLSPQTARFFDPAGPGRDHFIYYTPDALRRMLEKYGFSTVHLHQHLLHRNVSPAALAAELIAAPFRGLWSWTTRALGLNKEFWLIAKKS